MQPTHWGQLTGCSRGCLPSWFFASQCDHCPGEKRLADKISLKTNPADMQIAQSYLNCTEDTSLPVTAGLIFG